MLEALFGFMGGLIASLITVWVARIKNYGEIVSERRNVWLNEMRNNISRMLAYKKAIDCVEEEIKPQPQTKPQTKTQTKTKTKGGLFEKKVKLEKEYELAKNEILIRLNLTEGKHQLLKAAIEEFDTQDDYDSIAAEKILEISRSLLKDEWEKVKRETKGGE